MKHALYRTIIIRTFEPENNSINKVDTYRISKPRFEVVHGACTSICTGGDTSSAKTDCRIAAVQIDSRLNLTISLPGRVEKSNKSWREIEASIYI